MRILKYIALHHFGGKKGDPFASTQNTVSLDDVNESHRSRWPDFKSTLNFWVGYNFIILPNGEVVQTRALGEETAAQKGFNHNSISICLAGNFSLNWKKTVPIDKPTELQKKAVKKLIESLILIGASENYGGFKVIEGTQFMCGLDKIYAHRFFGNTTCYGDSLTDNWGRDLMIEHFEYKLGLFKKLLNLYMKLLDLYRKTRFRKISFKSLDDRECPGFIEN